MSIQQDNKLIAKFMNSKIFDYLDSGMKDISNKSIMEGSIINADGYNSDLKKHDFHCVEFYEGQFGCDIYTDFEPLSRYCVIEVIGHCSDFVYLLENGQWTGNLGEVVKGEVSCKYDSDWNELMSVVEKCREIEGRAESIYMEHIYSALKTCEIEIAYRPVVEYIEWYNKKESK